MSVPAAIRQFLDLTHGAVLEWSEEGGRMTVSRAVRHCTAEVQAALFYKADQPAASAKTLAELMQGIRQHTKRHAGR